MNVTFCRSKSTQEIKQCGLNIKRYDSTQNNYSYGGVCQQQRDPHNFQTILAFLLDGNQPLHLMKRGKDDFFQNRALICLTNNMMQKVLIHTNFDQK